MNKPLVNFTTTLEQRFFFPPQNNVSFFFKLSPSVSLLKLLSHSLGLRCCLSSSRRLSPQVHSYEYWPVLSFCPGTATNCQRRPV